MSYSLLHIPTGVIVANALTRKYKKDIKIQMKVFQQELVGIHAMFKSLESLPPDLAQTLISYGVFTTELGKVLKEISRMRPDISSLTIHWNVLKEFEIVKV